MTRDTHEDDSSFGRDLICAVIREQARTHACRRCDQVFDDCKVEVRDPAQGRLVAAVVCGSCGAAHLVTVIPTAHEGTASIR